MKQEEIFKRITDDIISALEGGNLPPWSRPWKANQNLISRRDYRGINQHALAARAINQGFASPYWLTFHQCDELGGHVKKGERSAIVIKWIWFKESDQETGEAKEGGRTWATQKYFNVFNLDQCEEVEPPKEEPKELSPLSECEKIVNGMPQKPVIKNEGTEAFYSPLQDYVSVPVLQAFESSETYYSTIFHELGHSTGHASRLARKEIMNLNFFGSHDYSQEELCAESCAAFLCGLAGIETKRTQENTQAYIKGWLEALKNDRKKLIYGIQNGQKAADYILGVKPDYNE